MTNPAEPAGLAQPDQSAPAGIRPAGAKSPQGNGVAGWRSQTGRFLTTAGGVRLPDTDHSLKAGYRGPTLLEDFHLREKITHFDHERIPERVVHARGAAADGVFTSYGTAVLEHAGIDALAPGVLIATSATVAQRKQLIRALGLHRVWERVPLITCGPPVT